MIEPTDDRLDRNVACRGRIDLRGSLRAADGDEACCAGSYQRPSHAIFSWPIVPVSQQSGAV
jgi:hypothetical protein